MTDPSTGPPPALGATPQLKNVRWSWGVYMDKQHFHVCVTDELVLLMQLQHGQKAPNNVLR